METKKKNIEKNEKKFFSENKKQEIKKLKLQNEINNLYSILKNKENSINNIKKQELDLDKKIENLNKEISEIDYDLNDENFFYNPSNYNKIINYTNNYKNKRKPFKINKFNLNNNNNIFFPNVSKSQKYKDPTLKEIEYLTSDIKDTLIKNKINNEKYFYNNKNYFNDENKFDEEDIESEYF